MSYSTALAKAKKLKEALLDHGVPEVSIELQTGRPTSFGDGSWDALMIVADMSHHTVSTYSSTNLTPVLALVKRGRTDVPGPLANGYGGWDLCYRIITFGYANHPGAGGPRTVPRIGGGTYTIPKDSARRYAWGTEYEGGIRESDWDRLLTNPRNGRRMTFREFMGRAGAGIHDYFNIHPYAHMEHSTWAPDRKIDRLRYTASSGRAEEQRYDAPLPQEDELPTVDEVWSHKISGGPQDGDAVVTALAEAATFSLDARNNSAEARSQGAEILANQAKVLAELAAIRAAVGADPVDEGNLAHQLAPLLAPTLVAAVVAEIGEAAGVTAEQVEAAQERALRRVLGSLNTDATEVSG